MRALAHELNDITNGRELRVAIMAAGQRLLHGNLVGINEVDVSTWRAVVLHWPDEPAITDLSERVSATLAEHPLARYYLHGRDRSPTKISDHVPDALQWRNHRVYAEVFAHIDAMHQLAIPLFPSAIPRRADAYAINREDGPDFTEEDRRLAALMQPVLISQHRRLPDHGDTTLTTRQLEVLWRLSHGEIQDDVAKHLNVSRTVIKRELDRCHFRLGTKNTTHAVARAIRLGLIIDDPCQTR